ncbi:MAG: polyprenyl synthetase family protein [Candidatus Aminicenantes bacterium]|nr:polyprenyl synthetase family protein [Candidatus Aminicenantes bacterium]
MIDYFTNLTDKVDKALIQDFNPDRGLLADSIHYALSVKGKRLRPLLFLTLIDAFKIEPFAYMDIACAVEYIHTYSLIHDDLPAMDNDDLRRGMPTVHKKFNEAVALLAGDTLLTAAFEKICRAKIKPAKITAVMSILTAGIGLLGMAGGQALDLDFKGDKNDILEIHRKKTAEFIKAVLLSAAEIIEMNEKEKEILGLVGITIGIAFQMADDLLDIEGDESLVGKKLNKDKKNLSPNSVLYFGKDYVKQEIDRSYRQTMVWLQELQIVFPPFLELMKKMVYRSK